MNNQIVVTTKEELENLVESSLRRVLNSSAKSNEPEKSDFLTVKQASQFLDLAPQTLYGLTCHKEIPYIKKGKRLYFLKTELESWLKEGRHVQNTAPRMQVKIKGAVKS